MKVLIHTLVWKRPEVTEITYKGFDRIQEKLDDAGIDSDVLITSSEPDHTAKAILRGYHVLEESNFPVATKFNTAMFHTLEYEWDYLMLMDSNNLLSNQYIEDWIQTAKDGKEFFGLSEFIALQADKKHISKFRTRKSYLHSNVGRGARRDVWEKTAEGGGFVNHPKNNSNLDGMCTRVVSGAALDGDSRRRTTLARGKYDACIDIKSDEDMHEHSRDMQVADIPYLIKLFPELKNWL